ncbi:hypothetical protein [Lewinella sp. LCG006]|uniref:hypothetical protein n=1 Tax=Lewinella sp. LCG006 TaxID=3231911 RepID=UPI00345F69E5
MGFNTVGRPPLCGGRFFCGVGILLVTNDHQNTWNGRFNEALAAPGNYVYFVEWIDLVGNVRTETGEVLLLR